MNRAVHVCILAAGLAALLASLAEAQTAPPPPPAAQAQPAPPVPQTVPPPPSFAPPASAVPAPPAPQCIPACRTGYVCHQGQCVSACNPPCPHGTLCTSTGQCVPAASYPATPPPPAAPLTGNPNLYPSSGPPTGVPGTWAETHDGFLLRVAFGFGGASTSKEEPAPKLTLSGMSAMLTLDVGGVIGNHLGIHARYSRFTLLSPTQKEEGGGSTMRDNSQFTMSLFGLGVSYFIMPQNMYVTGAVGFSGASATQDGVRLGEFGTGFGLNLDLGKEWWIGPEWSIGVAGSLMLLSVPDTEGGVTDDWNGITLGVLFSVTYD